MVPNCDLVEIYRSIILEVETRLHVNMEHLIRGVRGKTSMVYRLQYHTVGTACGIDQNDALYPLYNDW